MLGIWGRSRIYNQYYSKIMENQALELIIYYCMQELISMHKLPLWMKAHHFSMDIFAFYILLTDGNPTETSSEIN